MLSPPSADPIGPITFTSGTLSNWLRASHMPVDTGIRSWSLHTPLATCRSRFGCCCFMVGEHGLMATGGCIWRLRYRFAWSCFGVSSDSFNDTEVSMYLTTRAQAILIVRIKMKTKNANVVTNYGRHMDGLTETMQIYSSPSACYHPTDAARPFRPSVRLGNSVSFIDRNVARRHEKIHRTILRYFPPITQKSIW